MSTLYFVLLIIGVLPVIGYPAILMANLMSFAGHRPKDITWRTVWMMRSFIFLTTCYPVAYFLVLYMYKNRPPEDHLFWVGSIVVYWILIFIAISGWMLSEKKELNL